MQLLTDEASEQLSRGVSVVTDGVLGVAVTLFFAAVAHSPVGLVIADSAVIVAVWEWLWTDQTPAYLVSSLVAVLLLHVEYKLEETTETAGDSSDDRHETDKLWDRLCSTFERMVAVNVITIVVLSGVVAGVVTSKTTAAPLAVAVAFVYPVVDVRLSQRTRWVPTPIVVGAVVSIPLAVVPTLYTVPFHLGATVSKRFASVVDSATDRLVFFGTRVTDAVPGSLRLPTRLSPRRRS